MTKCFHGSRIRRVKFFIYVWKKVQKCLLHFNNGKKFLFITISTIKDCLNIFLDFLKMYNVRSAIFSGNFMQLGRNSSSRLFVKNGWQYSTYIVEEKGLKYGCNFEVYIKYFWLATDNGQSLWCFLIRLTIVRSANGSVSNLLHKNKRK